MYGGNVRLMHNFSWRIWREEISWET